MPEVNLSADLLNLVHVLFGQVRQLLSRCHRLDSIRIRASGHSGNALLDRPKEKYRCGVTAFTGFFGDAFGYLGKDGLERTSCRMTKNRCKRTIRLCEDSVFLMSCNDRIEMRQEVWVILELYRMDGRGKLGIPRNRRK